MALSPRAVLPEGDIREALRNMCEALWSPVLSSLSHVLAHCSDPLIVAMCADGYKAFAFAGGMLGETFYAVFEARFDGVEPGGVEPPNLKPSLRGFASMRKKNPEHNLIQWCSGRKRRS